MKTSRRLKSAKKEVSHECRDLLIFSKFLIQFYFPAKIQKPELKVGSKNFRSEKFEKINSRKTIHLPPTGFFQIPEVKIITWNFERSWRV